METWSCWTTSSILLDNFNWETFRFDIMDLEPFLLDYVNSGAFLDTAHTLADELWWMPLAWSA